MYDSKACIILVLEEGIYVFVISSLRPLNRVGCIARKGDKERDVNCNCVYICIYINYNIEIKSIEKMTQEVVDDMNTGWYFFFSL